MNSRQIDMAVLHDDAISILGLEKFLELSMTDKRGKFIIENSFSQKLFHRVMNFVRLVAEKAHWFQLNEDIRRIVIEPVLEACIRHDRQG